MLDVYLIIGGAIIGTAFYHIGKWIFQKGYKNGYKRRIWK